jgi:hypothetical protein
MYPTDDWDRFRADHGTWFQRCTTSSPIFALPSAAIDSLGSAPRSNTRALLSDADVRAERALTELCRRSFAIGFYDSRPISYPYLGSLTRIPAPSEAQMVEMGWTPAQQRAIEVCLDLLDTARERLKGVAGWLSIRPSAPRLRHLLADGRLCRRASVPGFHCAGHRGSRQH